MALVRKNFPDANAAEFSNTGRVWCNAVYNASGLIYEPTLQTCLFDDSWPADSGDRRRLGASAVTADSECEAVSSEDIDRLKTELKNELKAAHAEELDEQEKRLTAMMEDKLTKQLALQHAQMAKLMAEQIAGEMAKQTNALLDKLLNRTEPDK